MKETTNECWKTCTLAEAKDRWHSHTKHVLSDYVWEAYKVSGLKWSQRNGYWLASFETSSSGSVYLVFVKNAVGLVHALDYQSLSESEKKFLEEVEYGFEE